MACGVLAGSIKHCSVGAASAASKQQQPLPAGGSAAGPGSMKPAEYAAQQSAHHFSYQALPLPLQDASNLPLGQGQRPLQDAPYLPSAHGRGPFQDASYLPAGHGQRPGSAPSWEPAANHMLRQQDVVQHVVSTSSSDCFSMDPAQLEADIAALTGAIAADSAGPPTYSDQPEHDVRARANLSNRNKLSMHQGMPHCEQNQRDVDTAAESQINIWDSQPNQDSALWYHSQVVNDMADSQFADRRMAEAGGPAELHNLSELHMGCQEQTFSEKSDSK